MPNSHSNADDNATTVANSQTGGMRAKFQTGLQKVREFQEKIRPYQKTINKIRIVLYCIAIPWAIFIALKSMPYYAGIGKGESYFKQGLYDDAEREFLFCYEQCKTEDGKDPRLARVLNNLSVLYRGTGQYRLAMPYIKEAVEIAEKYFPNRQELPVSLSNEGSVLNETGQYQQAEQVYRRAIQIWDAKIRKDKDSKLGSIYNGLARSLREQGRLDEAEIAAQKALAIKEKASGKNSVDSAAVLENLGKIAEKKGAYEQAHKYLDQALSIDQNAVGEKHPDVASDQCSIGRLLTEEGKLDEANQFLTKSLATRKALYKPGHPAISKTLCSIGELNMKQDDLNKAIQNLSEALENQTKFLGSQHPDTLESAKELQVAKKLQTAKR